MTWLESVALLAGAAAATFHAESKMIGHALVVQSDARIHEFWMRRFQDPALFHDPLTEALLATGYSPSGFRFLYWLASYAVDPVTFGKLLPLVLQPLSVLLLFHIVRAHTAWRPAAWIAAGLFLVPWDIHRFSGGHPRAFAEPIVLLTVFLLLRRRDLAAVAVPAASFLFYPPAGLAALAIVVLAAFARRHRFLLDRRRAALAAVSAAGVGLIALVSRLVEGPHQLVSESQARAAPEFGPGGQMHFFASSTLEYLKQNYSGFNLRDSGSILAVAALALLAIRPRNVRLLRWEVWCMPIAALALFAAAHALLFRLYLPQRYTYPLLPFFCIAVAVVLRPTFESLAARGRAWLAPALAVPLAFAFLAVTVFPLGPQMPVSRFGSWLTNGVSYLLVGFAAGLLVAAALWVRAGRDNGLRAAAAGAAVVAGAVLVAEVAFAGGARSPSIVCKDAQLYRYLGTLPKEAIVAGDPRDVDCIPIAARRPVVISREFYQPWDLDYFKTIRARMFLTVAALYGPSVDPIVALRARYGADYFLVRNRVPRRAWSRMAPFTQEVAHLLRSGTEPAALALPAACETWRNRKFAVYRLACVAETAY